MSDGAGSLPTPCQIIAQYADLAGCGHYRIIEPASALNQAGLAQVATVAHWREAWVETEPASSIVVQVATSPLQLAQLSVLQTLHGVKLVQELDDLTSALPVDKLAAFGLPADISELTRRMTELADRVVVSTEVIADALHGKHRDIRVVPNRIDLGRWSGLTPMRVPGSKPRVGWAGGRTHHDDLLMLQAVVEALADEIDWVFFGSCPDSMLPWVQEFHHAVSFIEYPAKLARLGLDLAIAPLESTAFNEAKSNLKLLEYGILGYPVLCSDLLPYQCKLPVTRVANRPDAWVRTLRALLADRDALRRQGAMLRDAVVKDWALAPHVGDWLSAWVVAA